MKFDAVEMITETGEDIFTALINSLRPRVDQDIPDAANNFVDSLKKCFLYSDEKGVRNALNDYKNSELDTLELLAKMEKKLKFLKLKIVKLVQ